MRTDWLSNWRATSYRMMFWKLDGVLALIELFLLILFIFGRILGVTLWKVVFLFFALPIFFWILQKKGYDIPTFFRAIHYRLIGRRARGGRVPKYRRD